MDPRGFAIRGHRPGQACIGEWRDAEAEVVPFKCEEWGGEFGATAGALCCAWYEEVLMKNLLIGLIVVAVVGLGGWYLLSRFHLVDLPFPTKDDQVKVTITRPDIPNTLRITNKANLALKIQMFNAGDKVRIVPRAQWTLEPN